MSSTTLRPCLFCNHLNPGGAGFCNDCGSPLHLQPCASCGAINKLEAKACHKCGEKFSRSGSFDIARPLATNEIGAASDGSGLSAIAPTLLDDHRALSELNEAHITSERTPLPESVALKLSEIGQGSPRESKESRGKDVEAIVLKAENRNDGPEHSSDGLLHSDETDSTGGGATTRKSRLLWLVTVSVALLAAMALSVHYYRGQPTQLPQNEVVNQLPTPIAGVTAIAQPLPSSDAEIKAPQEQPTGKQCPEAIETLGLCSPDTKQEK